MRTVRECIWAGIAGVHIEDQLFPKRAHYHAYVVHNIPRDDFVDKIRLACKQRDELDKDFVIIARSDAARVTGLAEAIDRVNAAARVGADMGLVFPRTHDEAVADAQARQAAHDLCAKPGHARWPAALQLPGAQEHGLRRLHRRDTLDLRCPAFHGPRDAGAEKDGDYTGMSEPEFIAARKSVEILPVWKSLTASNARRSNA